MRDTFRGFLFFIPRKCHVRHGYNMDSCTAANVIMQHRLVLQGIHEG